jgi:hypothetical protein
VAKAVPRTLNCSSGAGKGLEVGDDDDRFGAGGLGLMPDLLDQRRPIDQRKSAAFMRDAKRDGAANALRRARNDGDLAGESFCEDHCRLTPAIRDFGGKRHTLTKLCPSERIARRAHILG